MWAVMSVQSERRAAGGASMHAHPQPVAVQDEVTANMVLTELAGDAATLHVDQMKNGPQSPVETQKLSKRRYTMSVGFKHPSLSKRRRRANSECNPVLPSNFLLGGNIFDPLNLNSLLDEEVSKALNAQTPKSSPLPRKNRDPVEILIPKDITDPLNLSGRGGDSAAGVLVSPLKSRRRHRNRHHPGAPAEPSDGERSKVDEGSASGPLFPGDTSAPDKVADTAAALEKSPHPYKLNTSINCRDEVVPPILPRRRPRPSSSSSVPQAQSSQLSKHRKRRRTNSRSDCLSITPTPPIKRTVAHSQTFHTPVVGGVCGAPPLGAGKTPQQRHRTQHRFQCGSYSRYYGYRTPSLNADPRLAVFKPEWFRGKKVLDVGCNTGHVTLAIARHWGPERVLGVDIDGALVHVARQNLRYFLSELHGLDESGRMWAGEGSEVKAGGQMGLAPLMGLQLGLCGQALHRFPVSFTRCRGPIATVPIMPHVPGLFPCNVYFLKGDYVPDSDEAVMSQSAEYDVILCLSLTKWVHLNYGDAGIQRLFHRIYRHLLPGGVLILEPQPWSCYSRRKRLTEVTYRNYRSIRLKPDQFSSFLTAEVGFSSYELIGTKGTAHPSSYIYYILYYGIY
uniref:RNA methyltransferase n=1 Tax=Sinocyclocheilus grahami TaxID=75366 RepID=A0A672KS29_SINGR